VWTPFYGIWLYDMPIKNGCLLCGEAFSPLVYDKPGNPKCCSFDHAEFDQRFEKVIYFCGIVGVAEPPLFFLRHHDWIIITHMLLL